MNLYETVFITRQELNITDVEKLTENLTKLITDLGGELVKQEYWGLRQLAYIIKKNKRGHYMMLNLKASQEAIAEFRRILALNEAANEEIIRFIILKIKNISAKPSPLAVSNRNKGE